MHKSVGVRQSARSALNLHAIEGRRLRYDSAERGLLREALSRALSRESRLQQTRRRNADLLAPIDPADSEWGPLKPIVGQLSGTVPGHAGLVWREGIGARSLIMVKWSELKRSSALVLAVWPHYRPLFERWIMQELVDRGELAPTWRAHGARRQ
jgi:hypothetical protein